MDAPAFPATEADLAGWSVYADWLLSTGDPLGELVARDLALPSAPDAGELRAFHELARRLCRTRETAPVAWTLGHARTMQLAGRYPFRHVRAHISQGTIANARDYLSTPRAARLEELETDAPQWDEMRMWRRIATVLPASCTRIRLTGQTWSNLQAVIDSLPSSVVALGGLSTEHAMATYVNDRFAEVELAKVGPVIERPLGHALAVSRTVRVRIADARACDLNWDRCTFAGPGDAALVGSGRATVLRGASLLERQRRFGPISIRAQLARHLPEKLDVIDRATLVRRLRGWTLKIDPAWHAPDAMNQCSHRNGELLVPDTVVPLHHGDRLLIGSVELVFVTTDVDDACRRAVAS